MDAMSQGQPPREPAIDPALVDLEPATLFALFDQLRRIPRPSLHEEGVRAWLRGLAGRHGWELAEDAAGNVVLRIDGRGHGRDAAPVIVQGHMDMVTEKRSDVDHDFLRDPIGLRRAHVDYGHGPRDVLLARGTTLGADNGIGVCTALAVALAPDVDHPPLELLFTANEETGMTGAIALDGSMLTGRRLVNLDAEEHGSLYLSCAGGRDLIATWEVRRHPRGSHDVPVRLQIHGLRGGHSGVDIHEGRASANVLLVKTLLHELVELDGVHLASVDGGTKRNAIAREAAAVLWVPASREAGFRAQVAAAFERIVEAARHTDPEVALSLEVLAGDAAAAVADPVDDALARAVLRALDGVPHGVQAWSPVVEGLVETSNNLAIICTAGPSAGGETAGVDVLRVECLSRSSKAGAIEGLQERIARTLTASGAKVEFRGAYPGWEADPHNPMVARTSATFARTFGSEPQIKAIHAGLECGILGQRLPGVAMVAFGPEIRDAHTPEEALVLDTVGPFWTLVVALMRDLCDRPGASVAEPG
jgi:dipeptidase D